MYRISTRTSKEMDYEDAEDKLLDLKTQLDDHFSGFYPLTFKQLRAVQEEIKLLKAMFPGLCYQLP